jgi:PAT family beta-lactamase induction signal transducer AmpG
MVLDTILVLPYAIIISGNYVQNLGIKNEDIVIYTSLLYLPWVIKPLDPLSTCTRPKKWFLAMQLVISIAFLVVGEHPKQLFLL